MVAQDIVGWRYQKMAALLQANNFSRQQITGAYTWDVAFYGETFKEFRDRMVNDHPARNKRSVLAAFHAVINTYK